MRARRVAQTKPGAVQRERGDAEETTEEKTKEVEVRTRPK